eukprot:CAMPEP_0172511942 /NCGR_PEP_ID=MMETSP1066-20121228/240507_1 /TAXON_ID=671091 /ORGANISM="Coscinodiscus wailesii, Strain CCMP2513" /LENGTH=261 /DNA_ID=CAMNT_0013291525 /DNA_START=86 /DNA_END=872 /DNA_ORIENTATION=-
MPPKFATLTTTQFSTHHSSPPNDHDSKIDITLLTAQTAHPCVQKYEEKDEHGNDLASFSSVSPLRGGHMPVLTSQYLREKSDLSSTVSILSAERFPVQQRRDYHTTRTNHIGTSSLIMGLGAVALTAKAGQYGVRAYEEWKASQPEVTESSRDDSTSKQETTEQQQKSEDDASKKSGKKENIFEKWFGLGVGSKYYEGGFEEKMTRREAALILGVRESATAKRIKEAHRKLLILNHPDTGGSKLISGKINEAKEILLRGKQ